jgi:hypothetical protein
MRSASVSKLFPLRLQPELDKGNQEGAFEPFDLLSSPDRLSVWDRRSPVSRFSSSDRVSAPDRRSLLFLRLPSLDRLSSSLTRISTGCSESSSIPHRVSLRARESAPEGDGFYRVFAFSPSCPQVCPETGCCILGDRSLLDSDHLPLHLGQLSGRLLVTADEECRRPEDYDGRRSRQSIICALLVLCTGQSRRPGRNRLRLVR